MIEQNQQKMKKVNFFLFVNSKSGGEKGKRYLTVLNHRLDYQYSKEVNITLYFVDLFNQEQKDRALQRLAKLVCKAQRGENQEIKVVVCGGDGTVIWVIEMIARHGIDTKQIVFTIIPIGTGNDFARCLGWGGSPLSFSGDRLDPLKIRIIQWLNGKESWFDLWTVDLKTYQDGTIFQIRNKQEVDTQQQQLNRGFCNYFGVGTDARICYSVQKRRQRNKWLNLALYGCIGFCKLFKSIRSTHQAVHEFKEGEIAGNEEGQKETFPNEQNESKVAALLNKGDSIQLKEGYGSMIALNSVRYMAGLKNVWGTAQLGVENNPLDAFTEQKFDDGKIEFVAFKNQLSLGLERFVNSGARVAQGTGPFSISFKRTETSTPTFVHIDGQAMKVRQLRSVNITKNDLVINGRIRVLMRREEE